MCCHLANENKNNISNKPYLKYVDGLILFPWIRIRYYYLHDKAVNLRDFFAVPVKFFCAQHTLLKVKIIVWIMVATNS